MLLLTDVVQVFGTRVWSLGNQYHIQIASSAGIAFPRNCLTYRVWIDDRYIQKNTIVAVSSSQY